MIASSGPTSGTTGTLLIGTDSTDNIGYSGATAGNNNVRKFSEVLVTYAAVIGYSASEAKKMAAFLNEIKITAHSSTTRAPYVPKIKLIFHFPIPRSLYNVRMLFSKSGYLPWRVRKKKKDM